MGFFSSIKNLFVRKSTTTQTSIPATTASVRSVDYVGGGYETTKTQTTPTSTGKTTTTTTTRSGSGGSAPSSTTTTTFTPKEETTLSPSSLSPSTYTGEPPKTATKTLGGAIIGTLGAIGNVGRIGSTQSISGYTSPIMESFKSYPGKPKAYDIAPNPLRYAYSGTGVGTSYDFPIKEQTYFQKSEAQRAELWGKAGLQYTGEPTSLIPQRVGEKVVAELKPQYQAKVDAGTLDVDTANIQFQTEAKSLYTSRTSGLDKAIGKQIAYEQNIFTPPAYKFAKTSFKIAETGALVGATAFGGSGLALASSAYLGAQTFRQGVSYVGDFGRMTTGEKIIGGAGLGLGAFATGYTFKLGTTRFYGEWRSTIYQGLESQKGRITGRELFKTDEASFFKTSVGKVSGVNTQITEAGTNVYKTGAERVGFFQKGRTTTRIFDPQYEKFVTTKSYFTQAGNLPVTENLAVGIKKGGFKVTAPDFSGGFGNAKFIQGESVTNYGFISASKLNQAGYYDVFAGGKPYRPGTTSAIGNVYSTGIRSRAYDFGKVTALRESPEGTFIISSGVSKTSFASTFRNAGAGTAYSTTLKASSLTAPKVIPSTLKQSYGAGTSILAVSATKTAPNIQATKIESSLKTSPLSASRISTTQIVDQGTRQKTIFSPVLRSGSGISRGTTRTIVVPAVTTTAIQAQQFKTGLRSGLITPGTFGRTTFTPAPPKFTPKGFAFILPLSFSNAGIGKNILTGGKRTTAYTPSFSALVFKLKGAYKPGRLAKSGLDFRPINQAFKIQRIKRI